MKKIGRCICTFALPATLALVVLAVAFGCHRKVERPTVKTYPVNGKVTSSRGKIPPAGTLIQFQQQKAELSASGLLESDGTFSLTTLYYEKKLPGAAEGTYRVTLLQTVNNGPGPQYDLKATYTVEPKENNLSVNMDDAVRR
jgi:hypothetical protein